MPPRTVRTARITFLVRNLLSPTLNCTLDVNISLAPRSTETSACCTPRTKEKREKKQTTTAVHSVHCCSHVSLTNLARPVIAASQSIKKPSAPLVGGRPSDSDFKAFVASQPPLPPPASLALLLAVFYPLIVRIIHPKLVVKRIGWFTLARKQKAWP